MPKSTVLAVSDLVGDRVSNIAGENLGWIEDVVLDLDHDRIAFAVLSFDERLGQPGKRFAVPWTLLRLSDDRDTLLLDVERTVLERAPGYPPDEVPDFADREWGQAIHGHYGEPTYW
jgi:sporulation protein YlmC with PRC-barrel domain